MSSQDSTSEFDKALDLMESSSDSSDKKWEDLKDAETLDTCKDLMDVRYLYISARLPVWLMWRLN